MAIQALGPNKVPNEGDLTPEEAVDRFTAIVNAWLFSLVIRPGESANWPIPWILQRQPKLLDELRKRFDVGSAGWICTISHDQQAGVDVLHFIRPSSS